MGGFLYNGCGAADTVKKLKLLRMEHCQICNKEREFHLAEVRMKIHVLWIPTIPVDRKYGIVCAGCKQGYIISEELMHRMMISDNATCSAIFDAVMHRSASSNDSEA